jgi:hypothetical protein
MPALVAKTYHEGEVMSDVTLGTHQFRVSEATTSLEFVPINVTDGKAGARRLSWEMRLPDLAGSPLSGHSPLIVLSARRDASPVGGLVLQWAEHFNAFRLTFVSTDDFLSLRYPDLSAHLMPVIAETDTESHAFVIQKGSDHIIGKPPRTLGRPAARVLTSLAEIRAPIDELAAHPSGVLREAATGANKCNADRKRRWFLIGVAAVAAALAVPTGGMSVAAVAASGALIGAAAGAKGAQTESDYKDCKEKAEKDKK